MEWRRRRAKQATKNVFFCFCFTPPDSLLLPLLSSSLPRAEPSRSLARSFPHTRRHVPRVRSQERAARAGRDGDGSGSGSAGKSCFLPAWNFPSLAFFSLCSLLCLRQRRRSSLPLFLQPARKKLSFFLARLPLRGPLRAPRGRNEAERTSLARKSTS